MTTFVRLDRPRPAHACTSTVRMRCCSLVCSCLGNYRPSLSPLVPHYLRFLSLSRVPPVLLPSSLSVQYGRASRRGGLNVASAQVGHDAEARAALDKAVHRCRRPQSRVDQCGRPGTSGSPVDLAPSPSHAGTTSLSYCATAAAYKCL
jgi:hypothetical protein